MSSEYADELKLVKAYAKEAHRTCRSLINRTIITKNTFAIMTNVNPRDIAETIEEVLRRREETYGSLEECLKTMERLDFIKSHGVVVAIPVAELYRKLEDAIYELYWQLDELLAALMKQK